MEDFEKIYKKIKKLDLSKWVLTKLFAYTSTVRDRIGTYDTFITKKGDPYIKDLYYHFMEIANLYKFGPSHIGLGLEDNKTTFEIMNIETGEKLYIGMYDANYHIGKSYYSEFGSYYEFGFIGHKYEEKEK